MKFDRIVVKDKNGTILKPGDVCAEVTGSELSSEGNYSYINLWQTPLGWMENMDGRAIKYTPDGTKYFFSWANPSNAVKLEKKNVPRKVFHDFYYGKSFLKIPDSLMVFDIQKAIKLSIMIKTAMPS